MLGEILGEVLGLLVVWMSNCDIHLIRQLLKIFFRTGVADLERKL